MKRKSQNVKKLKDFVTQDKKISEIYLKLKSILKKYNQKSYVVAVSGGPDSMTLAFLSALLAKSKKYIFHFVLIDQLL